MSYGYGNENLAPRGKHKARVLDWEFRRSAKGTSYIDVRFELPSRHIVYWMGFFTDKTLDRTVESLRYCGWTGDDIDRMADDGMGSLEPEVVVEHEEYEGKVRARVQWVNNGDPSVASKGAMDADDRRAFAAEMKSRIRAISAGQAQPAQRVSDDDIPF